VKLGSSLGFIAVVLSMVAVVAGLRASYETTVAAILGLGFVVSMRSLISGGSVHPWGSSRRVAAPRSGPVTLLTASVNEARRGSYFFQSQIAAILRSAKPQMPKEAISRGVLEPSREGRRLKGDKYLFELEAGVEALRDD